MPWLVHRDDEAEGAEGKGDGALLLVHVPRCGGTSLVKHFDVERKSRKGQGCYHGFGLLYFFYRYRLLEGSNFPVLTWENLYALLVIIGGTVLFIVRPGHCAGCPTGWSIYLWSSGVVTFLLSTFLMTAQIGRNTYLRRALMVLFGKIMCEFSSSLKYLHGISYKGFLMHHTAEKMVRQELIEAKDLQDSFAIVRNPYSRMVSVFHYNRMGGCESFEGFVRAWYDKWKSYRKSGSTEEWDVYCHVLPMYEFTHFKKRRLVPYIVRQEDLEDLSSETTSQEIENRYRELPSKIRDALQHMGSTRSNTRLSDIKKEWHEYYTQETMDLVLEMYWEDFEVFAYDIFIRERDDLVPKLSLNKVGSLFKACLDKSSYNAAKIRDFLNQENQATTDRGGRETAVSFESSAFKELDDDAAASVQLLIDDGNPQT